MNIEQENQGDLASSESSRNKESILGPVQGIGSLVEQFHSVNTLYFISAVLQVVLGVCVVTASVLGMIRPLWISTLISMLASVTTVVGLYLLYGLTVRGIDRSHLIRDAMRRIMNAQN